MVVLGQFSPQLPFMWNIVTTVQSIMLFILINQFLSLLTSFYLTDLMHLLIEILEIQHGQFFTMWSYHGIVLILLILFREQCSLSSWTLLKLTLPTRKM